jgi:hypothetical protein
MSNIARQRDTQFSVTEDKELTEKTLVIGNLARWNAQGRQTNPLEHVQFSDLGTLTQATLDELSPTVILSPLMGDNFDVLDVADRLTALGYSGRYRVISENLPNVQMIKSEVKAHAPDLDFDVLMMPPVANDG